LSWNTSTTPEQPPVRSKSVRGSNTWVAARKALLASVGNALAASVLGLTALYAGLQTQVVRGRLGLRNIVCFLRDFPSAWESSEIAPRVLKGWRKLDARASLSSAIEQLSRSVQFAARYIPHLRLKAAPAMLASASVLVAGYLGFCLATLPLGGGLVVEATPSALVVEADNGQVFATRGVFKGEKVSSSDLPPDLAHAVIAIEDRRFYHHHGVDIRAVIRAALHNVAAAGAREGGSTITQQLVRMTYLSPERTLKRKVQEAMLALWLESHLTKEEILVRYLNTAYFGAGVYGVDAAAKRYFGKTVQQLSLNESAMLAGLVRAPSALAPHRNLERARERAAHVLDAMVETGAISSEQADAARHQPIALRVPPETPPGTNYFVDMVDAEARLLAGPISADWEIHSTMDLRLQAIAERVVGKRLAAEGKAKNVNQAALVAMAHDGAILAMVGGRDYNDSQFNRVTQAKRQPGSLFKVFVYLAALERGYTPQTVMIDRPVQIGDWEPENYGGRYHGSVTLHTAFAKSINSVAVQLADEVGIRSVIEVAKKLGIRSNLPAVPSLALGSAEVNLLEMTSAFAAIAADVESVEAYSVRSIQRGDQTLHTRAAPIRPSSADPAAREAMIDLLMAVVREGTGKAARIPGPAAGKTGTTQDYRDAWFIGFTPEFVVGVWVGNDDNKPTNGVTGGSLPATIWREFVTQAAVQQVVPATSSLHTTPRVGASIEAIDPVPDQEPPSNARTIRGKAFVLDTGTLEIQGQIVRLFGVEGMSGRIARRLGRLLRRQKVICQPASAQEYRCAVDGQDLSELIVINGAGRATADAPAGLHVAEDRAREMRAGLWRRRFSWGEPPDDFRASESR
jgi:penicillin-binding protein 1A